MAKTAVGYLRVSHDDKDNNSASLARQKGAILRYCADNSITLIETFPDNGVSASVPFFARDGAKAAVAAAVAAECVILVEKLDRAFRSVRDFANTVFDLHQAGRELFSVGDPFDLREPSGYMMATVMVAFAECERAKIGERIRESISTRRDAGLRCSSVPEYGTKHVDKGKRTEKGELIWEVEPDEDEQTVRRRILGLRQGGHSIGGICRLLNAEGVPTRKGGPWSKASVNDILRRGRNGLAKASGKITGTSTPKVENHEP